VFDTSTVGDVADGSGDGVASQEGTNRKPVSLLKVTGSSKHRGPSMSSINSVGGNSPIQKIIQQPIQKQIPAEAPKQHPMVDKLELSGMSHLLKTLKSNDVRVDKVAEIRAQIEAGTYETEDKLDAAADKLLDDLMK
jgi:anti-sigma28 factor (negative regulator of flagellin synthesis)